MLMNRDTKWYILPRVIYKVIYLKVYIKGTLKVRDRFQSMGHLKV